MSRNKWDWLGEGIYFWEHGPHRALRWAEERAKVKGRHARPAVVGAVILLGSNVMDLTDVHFAPMLAKSHTVLAARFTAARLRLPANEESNRKRHNLDCLVINTLFRIPAIRAAYSVVRGAFEEGAPVFSGSMIKEETHIQLAVRDPSVICGLFKPAF